MHLLPWFSICDFYFTIKKLLKWVNLSPALFFENLLAGFSSGNFYVNYILVPNVNDFPNHNDLRTTI